MLDQVMWTLKFFSFQLWLNQLPIHDVDDEEETCEFNEKQKKTKEAT